MLRKEKKSNEIKYKCQSVFCLSQVFVPHSLPTQMSPLCDLSAYFVVGSFTSKYLPIILIIIIIIILIKSNKIMNVV